MDNDLFWTSIPLVDNKLWLRVRGRLEKPPLLFAKRMGMADQQSNIRLDNFFVIKGVQQKDETLVRWAKKSEFKLKNAVKVFEHICEHCLNHDLRVSQVEGTVICANCGTVASECFESPAATTEHYGPSTTVGTGHSDKPRRISQYIYKRCNHFRFWLARVQGKEASGVKPSVVEAVRRELAKERLSVGDPRITHAKVREVLKRLRLQRYYNNAWFITSSLSGCAAPQLTALQEEKLLSLFHSIQVPFAKYCPKGRVNMISYSYILKKMTEALGWHELSPLFPLLKSRAKVYAQDQIWKMICNDIGLPFIKSIS